MAKAIELAHFYLLEASRLADAAIVSREIDRAESLKRWLQEKWLEPEVMVRDVVRRGPNQLRESPSARAALTILVKHGQSCAILQRVFNLRRCDFCDFCEIGPSWVPNVAVVAIVAAL